MNDQQQSVEICRRINDISREVRNKHSFLAYQDRIGFGIFTVSILMILAGAYMYLSGQVAALPVILWIAFWTSILHELEHDLIHWLYFKNNPFFHHLMLAGVWLFRPLTVNPWIRRYWHYHHHKNSRYGHRHRRARRH
jgi:fatty acid desaturase